MQVLKLVLPLLLSCSVYAGEESVLTDLRKSCKEIDVTENQHVTSDCGSVGDYTLLVEWDDERNSITLKKGKKEMPLNLYTTVTGHFNELGKFAEWRVRQTKSKTTPYALIVRMAWTSREPKERGDTLVVTRIRGASACLIGLVDATKDPRAAEQARKIADDPKRSCLKR